MGGPLSALGQFWSAGHRATEAGRGALAWVVNTFLPHLCPLCQARVAGAGVCPQCWPQLSFLVDPLCCLCGNPGGPEAGVQLSPAASLSTPTSPALAPWLGPSLAPSSPALAAVSPSRSRWICRDCKEGAPHFHTHRSLWAYGPASRRLIFALKHGRQRHLAGWMARCLAPLALALGKQEAQVLTLSLAQRQRLLGLDCIIPVPLHPKRLTQRGFNQAAVLAHHLGRALGLPVLTQGLIRTRWTPSQGFLSFSDRQANVADSFSCPMEGRSFLRSPESTPTPSTPILPPRVLLIDDVFTTGATLNAAALALRHAGVRRVHCLTLAKVIP